MDKLVRFLFTLFFFFLYPVSGSAQTLNTFYEKIKSIMQEFDAIGVSVALVKENKISFSQSFGYNPNYSNPQARDSIKKEDIFWIASISKTFIATAIMQMVERGYLTLDDDINNYIDFCVRNPYHPSIPITIRMLLCHRSSLNGKKKCDNFDELRPELNKDFKSYYTEHEPGTDYNYCNIGYNILAAIIEKVSGMRFDKYLDKNILKPLNLYGGYDITKLDSTRFVKTLRYDKKKGKYFKVMSTYDYNKEKVDNYILGYSVPCFWPSGGMKISATDLAKFMLMHMNDGKIKRCKRIISKRSECEMREIQKGNISYGLAQAHYLNIIKGVELIGMTGGSRGIHSVMFYHPQKKYGFVVICNGCTSKSVNGIEMNKKIVQLMYDHFILGQ